MSEWHQMMVERAKELVAKGNLTPWQISQRTGISEHSILRFMKEHER